MHGKKSIHARKQNFRILFKMTKVIKKHRISANICFKLINLFQCIKVNLYLKRKQFLVPDFKKKSTKVIKEKKNICANVCFKLINLFQQYTHLIMCNENALK